METNLVLMNYLIFGQWNQYSNDLNISHIKIHAHCVPWALLCCYSEMATMEMTNTAPIYTLKSSLSQND